MNPPVPQPPARRLAAQQALALDDDALLAECTIEYFVAGGPGGQHRNKTESGVRLSHAATELTVTATERRSQFQNRGAALERLRAGLKQLCFVPKPRKKTRPTRSSVKRRIEQKTLLKRKKQERRNDW